MAISSRAALVALAAALAGCSRPGPRRHNVVLVRVVWWARARYQHVRPHAFVDAFEHLARADEPFGYPIYYLKPEA